MCVCVGGGGGLIFGRAFLTFFGGGERGRGEERIMIEILSYTVNSPLTDTLVSGQLYLRDAF